MAKILLVEDNEMNRDMLSRRLTRRGYAVTIATDGAEGVAVCSQLLPDLVLMDLGLPIVDGWEATRRIKAAAATRHIPVIALTAHSTFDEEAEANAAGCDDFETKPVEMERLLGKIERLLAESLTQRGAA
jgi:CheY-like chemotaxis protein